jgi:hypothetical protein
VAVVAVEAVGGAQAGLPARASVSGAMQAPAIVFQAVDAVGVACQP